MRSKNPLAKYNRNKEPNGGYHWARFSDEKLLQMRLCDLGLVLEKTPLIERVEQLYEELARRNLRLKPRCWLSDEWFSPDENPGIAIPFYLAHRRLMQLEDRMMLEVEGGTKTWCMQLLRHEAGHAIQSAFRLHRRANWRKVFGKATQRYPDYYSPKPFSKNYVLHLDWWYAQSHPCEDFAETFAVWLRPGSQWRKRYKGWPALRKLEYVDQLMSELAGMRPPVTSRKRMAPLSELRHTLREHYEARQATYAGDFPEFFDRDLRKLFAEAQDKPDAYRAAAFLRRIGPDLRRSIASWTGEPVYVVNQVLKEMITRCRELDLRVDHSLDKARMEAAILLTMQVTNYLHSTRHRVAV